MQLSMAGIHPDFAQGKKPPQGGVKIRRKDTIIIAMLVNIALLAVLFATASRQTQPVAVKKPELVVAKVEAVSQVAKSAIISDEPVDEIDEILKTYAIQTQSVEPVAKAVPTPVPAANPVSIPATLAGNYIEVTVKKGDVLSRIANLYGVTVEDIIVANHLDSAKLQIGQVLKIPQTAAKTAPLQTAEYYIVQDGDSPWKIAKKCHIRVEDLLKLNNLDEEKARNLKIGQKLRIR